MTIDSYRYTMIPGVAGGPLLFVFHGTGGDEHQLVQLGGEVAPSATIVSPRGDVSEGGAARFFRRTGEGVYDMEDLARATTKMTGFIEAHVAAHQAATVLGLGYSNGANILASTLFARPSLFDAVALMHPLIPFEPNIATGMAGKSILITAGRRDPICPPNLTARFESYLTAAGADVMMSWHEGGHELRPGEIEAAKALFGGLKGKTVSELDHIHFDQSETKGRYSLRSADGSEAELTFSKLGDAAIIIDHTGVPDVFRGQGVGLRLVTQAVEDARAAGKQITATTP